MPFSRPGGAFILALLMATVPMMIRASETVPADRAVIVVRLPAQASLWFEDSATKQTGPERSFMTPPLQQGMTYSYKVKARWEENGKPKTVERRVVLAAGKRVVVDLHAPEPRAAESPAQETPRRPPDSPDATVSPERGPPRSRTLQFAYGAVVRDLPPGKTARIWIPLAQSSAEQDLQLVTQKVPQGAKTTKEKDKQYGNHMLYVESQASSAGEIPIQLVFRVTRREVQTTGPHATLVKVAPEEDIERYLEPDVKVPVGGKPLELIKDKQVPPDQFAAAKLLYDVVNKHMTYSKKGTGWGQGDATWACTSGYGNCTDFHSLFISLARAEKIPSKFEMGFAIPAKEGSGPVAGYHCWAWFHPEGKGWIPVDISEANQNPSKEEYYFGNLTENRVQFSTGRDITLEPRQSAGPLNFFVYPYVEVDGQAYPAEKVDRHFSYKDVPRTSG